MATEINGVRPLSETCESSQPPAVVRGQLRKLEADSCVSAFLLG